MTDRSKFEEMLEHLINEDHESANELFHQLVVEKSREIYEGILAEDFGSFNELGEAEDDDMGAAEDEIGGDAADDFIDDVEHEGEMGDEMGSEGSDEDLEDRVVDLEDALDELRAEFESLMSQDDEMGSEEGEGEGEGDDFNWDDEMGSEEGEGDDEFPAKENFMREYIEKVTMPKGGDNGANTKSPVAKPNKMGGSAANIVKGGESTTGGTKGGLLNPAPKEDDMGNINVPGGNAGKTAFKHKEAGHGAEKKGAGDSAANKKSVLGSH